MFKSLTAEIETMQKGASKIYFVFDMGIPGVVFIKLVDWMRPFVDVKKVGLAIVEHVAETKEALSRFACRFIPVDVLCKANLADFMKFSEAIISKVFHESDRERTMWCMDFKSRCNEKAIRKDYFEALESKIDRLKNPISYDDADYEILIEVFRDMLVFAILPNYKKLKKYNL